jgi:hypothetical protein
MLMQNVECSTNVILNNSENFLFIFQTKRLPHPSKFLPLLIKSEFSLLINFSDVNNVLHKKSQGVRNFVNHFSIDTLKGVFHRSGIKGQLCKLFVWKTEGNAAQLSKMTVTCRSTC